MKCIENEVWYYNSRMLGGKQSISTVGKVFHHHEVSYVNVKGSNVYAHFTCFLPFLNGITNPPPPGCDIMDIHISIDHEN